MLCPECSHDNRAGASFCESCGHELGQRTGSVSEDPSKARLAREPLSALSPKEPVFVAPDASVAHAVDTMNQLNIGCVLVGSLDRVAGIFTERDLLFGIGEKYEEAKERPVADFMTPDPEMLDADTPLLHVLNRMAAGGFRHIPVTRAGRLVGIVSLRDLLGLVSKWYPDLVG
jgi:CBS domain-containing protein